MFLVWWCGGGGVCVVSLHRCLVGIKCVLEARSGVVGRACSAACSCGRPWSVRGVGRSRSHRVFLLPLLRRVPTTAGGPAWRPRSHGQHSQTARGVRCAPSTPPHVFLVSSVVCSCCYSVLLHLIPVPLLSWSLSQSISSWKRCRRCGSCLGIPRRVARC